MLLSDMFCQLINPLRCYITSHKAHASDGISCFRDELVECLCGQIVAFILPKKTAMAARTATRTAGNVDGKRHFVREFLKDYVCVDIV
jgi:hypothetical protein